MVKKQIHNKVLVVTASLILIGILIFLQFKERLNNLDKEFSAADLDFEKWITYSSDRFQFEVMYPYGWVITNELNYSVDFVDEKSFHSFTDAAFLSIWFDDPTGYFTEVKHESKILGPFIFDNGYRAKTFFYNQGKKVYAFCFFEKYGPSQTEEMSASVLNTCNKILSTFKFT